MSNLSNTQHFVAVARAAGGRAEVEPITKALDSIGELTAKKVEDLAFLFGTRTKGTVAQLVDGIATKAPLGAAALRAKLGLGRGTAPA